MYNGFFYDLAVWIKSLSDLELLGVSVCVLVLVVLLAAIIGEFTNPLSD